MVAIEPSRTGVLVVEDQPVNQRVVTRVLERLGCAVEVACDGLEGVEAAQRGHDFVRMGCRMPRCDGYEATRRTHALGAPVAHTQRTARAAHATDPDRARGLEAGLVHIALATTRGDR